MKYCNRCLMPETQEKNRFDDLGIWLACQSSEDKMHINWREKDKELRKILNDAKKNLEIIMIVYFHFLEVKTVFQAHLLTQVYNVKPLAVILVTLVTKTGIYNLNLCLKLSI